MKSASDRTLMAPTAFGLLMDPAYLRRAAGDTNDIFGNAALDRASHRPDWSWLRHRARALRLWVFRRAAR